MQTHCRGLETLSSGDVHPSWPPIHIEFIANFANWDNSANKEFLETSRAHVKVAHPEEPPLVDPSAGGGSIPLEALRLGCDAFAGDLNPVACLILKVILEDIPRHGPALGFTDFFAGKMPALRAKPKRL